MDEKNQKRVYYLIIAIATIILVAVGSTFAYFNASVNSAPDAVNMSSAKFVIDFKDDTDLIKSALIPSIEEYVDITSKRVDENGNFLKPYENPDTKEEIKKGTACIDDNQNEICSMYTFTIINPMTTNDLPLYVTIEPSYNTFENLYFKVLDSELNEVISATHLLDSRYKIDEETGTYLKDEKDEWVKKENFETLTMEPYVLTNINKTLAKAIDEDTPTSVTYTIVMWLMENNKPQNDSDSGKLFASTLKVSASGADGQGITGIFSLAGTE